MRRSEFKDIPVEVYEKFVEVLIKEKEFIGCKNIDNGYLIKRNKNKATMTLDIDKNIYSLKFIYQDGRWKMSSVPSVWPNIKDLLLFQ